MNHYDVLKNIICKEGHKGFIRSDGIKYYETNYNSLCIFALHKLYKNNIFDDLRIDILEILESYVDIEFNIVRKNILLESDHTVFDLNDFRPIDPPSNSCMMRKNKFFAINFTIQTLVSIFYSSRSKDKIKYILENHLGMLFDFSLKHNLLLTHELLLLKISLRKINSLNLDSDKCKIIPSYLEFINKILNRYKNNECYNYFESNSDNLDQYKMMLIPFIFDNNQDHLLEKNIKLILSNNNMPKDDKFPLIINNGILDLSMTLMFYYKLYYAKKLFIGTNIHDQKKISMDFIEKINKMFSNCCSSSHVK